MAFFGLSDISFSKGAVDRRGPLADLVDTKFKQTTLRYPIDIGNYDKGHYMVFYIRQQQRTSFPAGTTKESSIDAPAGGVETKLLNLSIPGTNLGGELLGKINSGLASLNSATGGALSGVTGAVSSAAGGIIGGINNLFGQKASTLAGDGAETTAIIDNSIKKITGGGLKLLRTTQLTTDAIALYMPDTLNYSYTQSYDQQSLGGDLLGQAIAAGKSAIDTAKSTGDAQSVAGIAKAGAGAKAALESGGLYLLNKGAGEFGATGQALFTAATGKVVNPMLEMIYKSPGFRSFQFEFTFYPRDEKEALEVQRIIERFRFHQAPELAKETQGFLIPPSEFEIKFYYGGAQNPNIPQIATCILTQIDTNYAPNGWSAYEVPGDNNKPAIGRTGMPTSIQMSLQFQEVTYLTKADFKKETVGQTTLAR